MVFKIKNLSVKIHHQSILEKINIELPLQKLGAILAPNGNGKTTLMHSLIGYIKPYEGGVFYDEKNLLTLSPAQRSSYIAYIPQNFSCAFDYTVWDFTLLGATHQLKWYQNPTQRIHQRAIEILTNLQIIHLKNQSILHLSGGEKQMVLLARAFLQNAKILLLDEPTSWLDIKNQNIFFETLKTQIKQNQICALINIHDPTLIARYADFIFMIKNGKNLFSGPTQDMLDESKLSLLYDLPILLHRFENEILITPKLQ